MHFKDFEDLIENFALTHPPAPGKKFYMAMENRSWNGDPNDVGGDAYAFLRKSHAVACAKAQSNGNIPRAVIECVVCEQIPSTDEMGRPTKKAKYTKKYR